MHLGSGRAPRPARPPPHDSGTILRRDDALSRGPIARSRPRIFKRIAVSFGSPVDYTDLLAMPRTRETAQAVIDRVMAAIRVQHAELQGRRRRDVAAVDEARRSTL